MVSGDLSVRLWFQVSPEANSTVRPGFPYTLQIHCEPSRPSDYRLSVWVDLLRADGSRIGGGISPDSGETNGTFPLSGCGSAQQLTANFPFVFAPIGAYTSVAHVRVRAWIFPAQPTVPAGFSPDTPQLIALEPVNWRASQ